MLSYLYRLFRFYTLQDWLSLLVLVLIPNSSFLIIHYLIFFPCQIELLHAKIHAQTSSFSSCIIYLFRFLLCVRDFLYNPSIHLLFVLLSSAINIHVQHLAFSEPMHTQSGYSLIASIPHIHDCHQGVAEERNN